MRENFLENEAHQSWDAAGHLVRFRPCQTPRQRDFGTERNIL